MPSAAPQTLAPAFRGPQNGTGPAWLSQRRKKALAGFQRTGFPTTHEEDWKYTDLQGLSTIPFTAAERAPFTSADVAQLGLPDLGAPRLVFTNGFFSAELSDLTRLPKGVTFHSLREATAKRDAVKESFAGLQVETPFSNLNDALWHDGALIELDKGARLERLHVVHLHDATRAPMAVHPRVHVRAGALSEATIVESFAGRGAQAALVNGITLLEAANEARIQHATLQQQPGPTRHFHQVEATLGRAAHYAHHNLTLGSDLSRVDVNVRFRNEGGEATLNGLYLLRGSQFHDTHSRVDHAVPHCTSREYYKGILDDKSHGVFYGKVFVRKDAQKTNASQTNKNLLLSTGALVDSIPALEINANDVKANHGSTIGQLDATSVFYLRSRGLDEATARSLLTYAFARDLIGQVPLEPLRRHLDAELAARLPAGRTVQEALHGTP